MPDDQGQVPTPDPAQAAASTTPDATDPAAAQAAQPEKVYTEDYVKRLRAENAGYRTRLNDLEQASKTEALGLAEKAAQADQLAPKVERYQSAVASLVEEMKAGLSPDLAALMPEGDPVDQLDWLKRAQKVKPAGGLPPAGTRTPPDGGAQAAQAAQSEERLKDLQRRIPALANRPMR
jgi:hypothetical protein